MRLFILILGLWTTVEGGLSCLWPSLAKKGMRLISRSLYQWVESWPESDLRKLGALECGFGIWMLLLWYFTRA